MLLVLITCTDAKTHEQGADGLVRCARCRFCACVFVQPVKPHGIGRIVRRNALRDQPRHGRFQDDKLVGKRGLFVG
jgi:hypothetical protein